MQEYLQDILNDSQENEEIFNALTNLAMDMEIEDGFDDLSDIERKSFMIGIFLMEVNNGGFDQYFLNNKGRYAVATLGFLDFIEEKIFSKLLDESISIYKAVISDDIKMVEFEKLDKRYYEISSEGYEILYEKFVSYIRNMTENI